MENIYQFAFVLLSSVGSASLILFALSSWLGKVWANRILEADKAKYTQELDIIRQQFKIELNQLSIIHENQKSSFQRVIKGLQKSIKSLEQGYDVEWYPIKEQYFNELEQIIVEEALFLGSEGESALRIYLDFFGRTIEFPEDRALRNIYQHMIFISEKIREYFRKRIGLSEEIDPLCDVNLLASCLLINNYPFNKTDLPTHSALKFSFDISPQALVDKIKNNISILESELKKLINYFESKPNKKKHYFHTLSKALYYLEMIEKA